MTHQIFLSFNTVGKTIVLKLNNNFKQKNNFKAILISRKVSTTHTLNQIIINNSITKVVLKIHSTIIAIVKLTKTLIMINTKIKVTTTNSTMDFFFQ